MKKVLLFFQLLFTTMTYCQDHNNISDKNQQSVLNLNNSINQEKAYLQFDKSYYAVGDTIYFKAYLTLGGEHKLSALSGILYVDLITPENKIAQALKLQITAGTASGDFILTDTLSGGNYKVRAYTKWMRNESDDSFFDKLIRVGSMENKRIAEGAETAKVKSNLINKSIRKTDIQFMPEGGKLVTGNYSKIAFKTVGPDGLGENIKGVVTDERGEEICLFKSGHAGMGCFTFVPMENKTYKANISFADGTSLTVPLPKANSNGYTLSANNANADTLKIRVTGNVNNSTEGLLLMVQAQGKVYYAVENKSNNKLFSVMIPKNKFPSGIIQITLLSPTGESLNERLAFVDRNGAKFDLKLNKPSYTAREKVDVQFSSKTENNKVATGTYSIAVTDEAKVPTDSVNEVTILTSLLLTSDLKGYIYHPDYYFTNPSDKTKADLDNLLLTQGYRHFIWKQINEMAAAKYQPESAIAISGTVKRNNKAVFGARVKLFSKAGGMFMLDTLTDINGKFAFKNLIFADSTKFVIQSRVNKGQDNVMLELDTGNNNPQIATRTIPTNFTSLNNTDIENYSRKAQQFYDEQKKYGINQHPVLLKEVKVEAKKEPLIPHSQNLNGPGGADQVLTEADLDKLNCVGLIINCLGAAIPEVVFGKTAAGSRRGMGGSMAIIVDGTFTDYQDFIYMHTDEIEGVEVALGAHYSAIYGSRAAGGALIITTRHAKKQNNYYRYAPGVVTYTPKGFYKAREFYSPQYDNPHTNQKMADLRSTIYWNPNIITDKDGKASFSYFNADGKGTYRVVVEGIDADGNLGRQVFRYKVE